MKIDEDLAAVAAFTEADQFAERAHIAESRAQTDKSLGAERDSSRIRRAMKPMSQIWSRNH